MRRFKPSRKPAIGAIQAAVTVACMFVSYFVFPPLFWGVVAVAVAVEGIKALLIAREPPPKRGRELSISGGVLRQCDLGQVVAEIDVNRPFEYKILDRYDVADAVFRLYQHGDELTFYTSDPEGTEMVKNVVQIAWPPRERHMGR